jgi:superfamily II DNA or RNA helicase
MRLARSCQRSFPPGALIRGRRYFTSGRVRITAIADEGIEAEVAGSRRKPYDVFVHWRDIDDGEVVASCSCPHFQGGTLCKHVWATLLEIDETGRSKHLSGPSRVRVRRAPASDLEEPLFDDDLEDRALDFTELEQRDAAVGGRRATGPARSDLSRVGRPSPAAGAETPRRTAFRRSPSETSTRFPWQTRLRQIGEYARLHAEVASGLEDVPGQRTGEVWYVLDRSATARDNRLHVEFRQRLPKQDGTFGRMRVLSVRPGEPPQRTTAQDRALLEMLIGNQGETAAYGAYQPYGQLDGAAPVTRASISPAMQDLVLPRLCATGRFVWVRNETQPVEQGHAISWDGGEAWRLRLSIDADDGERKWRFRGLLHRGEEERPLDDVRLITAYGMILFEDTLARGDVRDVFGWIATLRDPAGLEVPYADRTALLREIAALPRLPDLRFPSNLACERVTERPSPHLRIQSPRNAPAGLRGRLFATAVFRYGNEEVSREDGDAAIFDAEGDRLLVRDRECEAELLRQLDDLGLTAVPRGSQFEEDGEFHFPDKILPDIAGTLTSRGWTVEAEGVRIRSAGAINIAVTSGVDWFDLRGTADFGGASLSLPRLLRSLRRNERYVRLDDGTRGVIPEEWLERYRSLAAMAGDASDGEAVRFSRAQALFLDALLAEQADVTTDRDFRAFRAKLAKSQGAKAREKPSGFHGTLRDYQKEGHGWLHYLCELGLGGCLADDMGLGKTVQALALLEARRTRRLAKGEKRLPSIVVAPKSLIFNWIDEAHRFTPKLDVVDYTGSERKARLEAVRGGDLVVTTYGTLRRDVTTLRNVAFDHAILDEAQAIKNADSQAAKASRLLRAEHRLAMTGTPVENHIGELWSLFEFLNPGMLGRSKAFETLTKRSASSNGNALELVGRAVQPFLLRRTKEQVLSELPAKTEQTLHCELSAAERKEYRDLRDHYRASLAKRIDDEGIEKSKIHVLEALLRLRQAACHPGLLDKRRRGEPSAKLETLLEQLDEIVEEGHKALVFSQFTSLLAIVRAQLDRRKITYEYLDGRTRDRRQRVERFQNDPACSAFLISLKAGGHGLNLTAADYVFILDPWWNPAVEAQAIDRAHRLGQTRNVFAYRIIARDTVEESIVELQATKRELADAIVGGDNSLVRSLTEEDLSLLLG